MHEEIKQQDFLQIVQMFSCTSLYTELSFFRWETMNTVRKIDVFKNNASSAYSMRSFRK